MLTIAFPSFSIKRRLRPPSTMPSSAAFDLPGLPDRPPRPPRDARYSLPGAAGAYDLPPSGAGGPPRSRYDNDGPPLAGRDPYDRYDNAQAPPSRRDSYATSGGGGDYGDRRGPAAPAGDFGGGFGRSRSPEYDGTSRRLGFSIS
ncbi:hypothetical protein P7C70_g819, partial [Phenoliferia sp. Uapishka_3]